MFRLLEKFHHHGSYGICCHLLYSIALQRSWYHRSLCCSHAEAASLYHWEVLWVCRLYNTDGRRLKVWDRLIHDGTTRRRLPHKQYEYVGGTTTIASDEMGYNQCVTNKNCTEPPPGSWIVDPPLHTLHRVTLERYQKQWPLDFYSSLRLQTQTTNQTLRCAKKSLR